MSRHHLKAVREERVLLAGVDVLGRAASAAAGTTAAAALPGDKLLRSLLQGRDLRDVLGRELASSQPGLKKLDVNQLASLRSKNQFDTASRSHEVHTNFIRSLDRLLCERLVERHMVDDSATVHVDAKAALGRLMLLVLGAERIYADDELGGGLTEAVPEPAPKRPPLVLPAQWLLFLDHTSWNGCSLAMFHTGDMRVKLLVADDAEHLASAGVKGSVAVVTDRTQVTGSIRMFDWEVTAVDRLEDVAAEIKKAKRRSVKTMPGAGCSELSALLARRRAATDEASPTAVSSNQGLSTLQPEAPKEAPKPDFRASLAKRKEEAAERRRQQVAKKAKPELVYEPRAVPSKAAEGTPRWGSSVDQGLRARMEDAVATGEDKGSEYYGVFDGHGGTEAVAFITERVPQKLVAHFAAGGADGLSSLQQALSSMFAEADEELHQFLKARFPANSLAESRTTPGCVGTVVVVRGEEVVLANLGDCRAVWSEGGTMELLTEDHRPAVNKAEQRRLAAMGVEVSCDGYIHSRLEVCRAWGDFAAQGKLPGLLAEPDITGRKVTASSEFLVLACDGVFERLAWEEVGKIARRKLRSGGDPKAAAEAITSTALKAGSTDNVSCLVVLFKAPPPLERAASKLFGRSRFRLAEVEPAEVGHAPAPLAPLVADEGNVRAASVADDTPDEVEIDCDEVCLIGDILISQLIEDAAAVCAYQSEAFGAMEADDAEQASACKPDEPMAVEADDGEQVCACEPDALGAMEADDGEQVELDCDDECVVSDLLVDQIIMCAAEAVELPRSASRLAVPEVQPGEAIVFSLSDGEDDEVAMAEEPQAIVFSLSDGEDDEVAMVEEPQVFVFNMAEDSDGEHDGHDGQSSDYDDPTSAAWEFEVPRALKVTNLIDFAECNVRC